MFYNNSHHIIKHSRFWVIAHDVLMVTLAWLIALFIRLGIDIELYANPYMQVAQHLGVVVSCQSLVFWWTGLYKGVWRFASLPDLWNIFRSCLAGVIVISLAFFFINRLEGIPRSILAAYPLILMALLGVPRLVYRFWKDGHLVGLRASSSLPRVIVLGAGHAGELLIRDMRRSKNYIPIGFVDDNPQLKHCKIQGVSVLGSIDDLKEIVNLIGIDLLIIAIPSATNKQMQRIVEICEDCGVLFKTLPHMRNLMQVKSALENIKEVVIDDLLGRDPVQLDWQSITSGLSGKTILITGGGGSIGSGLCRQIAQLNPIELIILDHHELNLYQIERELRINFPDLAVRGVLANVCDEIAIIRVMKRYSPEIVFHAAAYKQVPLLQEQIRAAVKNNAIGTGIVASVANEFNVKMFVMVSTDKAVNPSSVMGSTKRVAEIFCQTLAKHSNTKYITVRFGNVLNSAGSVIPLFQEQINHGGPVTVTHPEVSRYFMTIPEACQLILQAAVVGDSSEIYVLDMGKPIKIKYLAEQMIRLVGKRPNQDIKLIFTGLRPGEKLYEELFHENESYNKTSHKKLLLASHREVKWSVFLRQMDLLKKACDDYDEQAILELLNQIVPEQLGKTDDNMVIPIQRKIRR